MSYKSILSQLGEGSQHPIIVHFEDVCANLKSDLSGVNDRPRFSPKAIPITNHKSREDAKHDLGMLKNFLSQIACSPGHFIGITNHLGRIASHSAM